MNYRLYIIAALFGLTSCSTNVPEKFKENGNDAPIYPDYTNCVIPCNIAPLNFVVKDSADDAVVLITPSVGEKLSISANGDNSIIIPEKDWKQMLTANVGKTLKYDLYVKKAGEWSHYKSFSDTVSADSIDRYLTYRLIEPSYMGTGEIGVYQHDIEENVETVIFDNHRFHMNPNVRGQKCVNCHTSQRNHPENKMFYYRGANGGLLLTYNGQVKKINTRCGNMFAGTVYPAWHPTLPLIAFSSNVIKQSFPTFQRNKVEPYDEYSDLVLYNIEKNEVTAILRTHNAQETNPNWSPDGKYLYFNSSDSTYAKVQNLKHLKYNLFRMAFDVKTMKWGQPELVYDAVATSHSATYPRVSPDGKFLLFTRADYGTSTQTNKSADLYLLDLANNTCRELKEVNCPTESDSYHDWAGNSKWFVFSSRRYDGNYSRPYFSHIGPNGVASKPVQIPHADPHHDLDLLKCYNVPEFSKTPVTHSPADFESAIESEEVKATYGSPIDPKDADAVSGATPMK